MSSKITLIGVSDAKLGNLNSGFFDKNITQIHQPSETAEVLKELERDELDASTKMSSMDTKANLKPVEVSYVCAYDVLCSIGCIPSRLSTLTRSKKRLSASENRTGRDDYVNIVSGKKESDVKTTPFGMTDRIKGFFGGKT